MLERCFKKDFLLIIFLLNLNFTAFSQPFKSGVQPAFPAYGFVILKSGKAIAVSIESMRLTKNYISSIRLDKKIGESNEVSGENIQRFGIKAVFDETDHKYDTDKDRVRNNENSWLFYNLRTLAKSGDKVFMLALENGRITVYQNPTSTYTYSAGYSSETSVINGIHPTIDPTLDYSIEGGELQIYADLGFELNPTYNLSSYSTGANSYYSSYYYEKDGGELIKISKKDYDTVWPVIFGDCPLLEAYINDDPKLIKFKNFMKLVKLYNSNCN